MSDESQSLVPPVEAWLHLSANFGLFLRFAIPILIAVKSVQLFFIFLGSVFLGISGGEYFYFLAFSMFGLATAVVIGANFAIKWHIFCVEENSQFQRPPRLWYGRLHRKFVGIALLMFLLAGAPFGYVAMIRQLPPAGLDGGAQDYVLYAIGWGSVGAILLWTFVARFSFLLPSLAVGKQLSVIEAFRGSSGMGVRIIFSILFAVLPMILLTRLLSRYATGVFADTGFWGTLIYPLLVELVSGLISLAGSAVAIFIICRYYKCVIERQIPI